MGGFRAVFAACVFSLGVSAAGAQTAAADDPLAGIWASESAYAPAARGALTIVRDATNWRGTTSGFEAQSAAAGETIRLAFRDGVGKFRGTLEDGGRAIRGFWLQSSGGTNDPNDPPGPVQSYSTPLILARTGTNTWRGIVRPPTSTFTLYLRIFNGPDGPIAAFRNPEYNLNGGASQFRVQRDGDAIRFTAGSDPAHPDISRTATFDASSGRIRMEWAPIGRTIEFTRRTPAQAPNYFPRPPGEPRYAYRKPPVTGDGWATARARDVGLDEAGLTQLVRDIAEADPAVRRPSLIHSILVAYRGRLVLEEYFFGYGRDTPHDTRSAGKTFASVMLGAAMMRGAHVGPETPVYEVLSDMGPFANPDPRKAQITLAHLMTHNSGLACNDNDDASPGNEETMQSQTAQPNWWKYTLDLPMAHDPGSRYAYCSANMNLVGGALTAATQTWLPELFDQTIARPLQFGRYHWNLMPTGEGYQGGGAYLRPRDLLKVGQAYLDGGVWNGRRIVPASWIAQSTETRVHISPATTGLTADEFGNFYGEGDDAYAWHIAQLRTADRAYRAYGASGNGGQLLVVVPDAHLVVVFTGGNYGQGGIWNKWRDELIPQRIIPAIRQ